jgi:predicted TPR repeat methyltransferase
MIFPKPEWIRYEVRYRSLKVDSELNLKTNSEFAVNKIYIYAHGEQMVRDILDEYVVTKIERTDKDG